VVDRNDYQTWISLYDTHDANSIERIHEDISCFENYPKISIIMPVFNPSLEFLMQAIESVQSQLYFNWELCIADDASTDDQIKPLLENQALKDSRIKLHFRSVNGHISAASNSALELATGDFVALLDQDDLLSINALYCVAKAIIENPDVVLIYSDEDKIDKNGRRHNPYFKTNWNPDLFYSHNMICHLGVYKRSIINAIGGFQMGLEGAQDYDLALRFIERIRVDQILHLPFVLYHWRVHPASTAMSADAKPYAMIAGERAINQHFMRIGVKGRVELVDHGYHPYYELPMPTPMVSIIIPTRNSHQLTMQCIRSIQCLSTYASYEILLIDNSSNDPESLKVWRQLEKEGVRVLRDDSPFNYSALNNKAAEVAHGEVFLLLNNDTEVIEPKWLEIMVSHAIRPDIGAVGAKLLYPNRTIQHAGVVLGLGGLAGAAGHAHYKFPENSHGYAGRISLTSNFSAVTGACLAVRRDLYFQVGGLDEVNLQVAFNDVDFCLKLGELGYRCVYAPDAVLYHHESASRGAEDNPQKLARFKKETDWMRSRWGNLINNDPFYNPNLTLERADFSLSWPPRVLSTTTKNHLNSNY
jgi:glycosyltransferase involved in cell wall biosynthesis